ncbi:hypothetical protein AMATHDRAFT_167096, partial [Amanita thiersii Skay4041]
LQQYAHNKWTDEVTSLLISELNAMSEQNALTAIYELKQKPTVVRTTGNNQMDVKCIVSMTDTLETFETSLTALLDSGCIGSCVNQEFIQKHRLNTIPLPCPIPVYNVDRTRNNIGSLMHKIQL